MSDYLAPQFRQQFFNANGLPLAGGQIYTYAAGTTTPQATYTSSTGSTPNTNPIVLDSSGSANIWIGTLSYKFVVEDSLGNVLETVDGISIPSGGGGGGGGGVWGSITGTLSSQTDLESVLTSLAPIASPTFSGTVTTPLSTGIVKSTSGVLGLGTAGTDYSNGTAALTTGILKSTTTTGALTIAVGADFPTLNQNTTGTAATFTGSLTGDVVSTGMATTVGKINGTSLAGLSTGILKNTTTTGVPSIAIAADFPTLNQSTSGNAATATSATSATTATNATNGATVSTSTSSSYFPLFAASSTNSNQPFNLGTGLTFNPSTNNLTTTTFTGALTGNVTGTAANVTSTTNSTLTTLSGLTTASSLVTVGTIATGTWNATAIGTAKGGTGQTSVIVAPTASTYAGWDANKNFSANNHISLSTSTATAASTTTLTVASTEVQAFTGSTTQTVVLPAVSTLVLGTQFTIINQSTGVVTVQSSGANAIQAMAAGSLLQITSNATSGTAATVWTALYSVGAAPTFSGLTTNGAIYANASTTVASAGTGTAGQVFTSNGSGSAPTMQNSPTASYAQAFHVNGNTWTNTGTAFSNMTHGSGTATLTVRNSSGITLTAAASSLPGIVFTPAASTAVYKITATFVHVGDGNFSYYQFSDGTHSTGSVTTPVNTGVDIPVTFSGIYVPGTASPVTVQIQSAVTSGGTTTINSTSNALGSSIEWSIVRIF
jgi:hypothetical protein